MVVSLLADTIGRLFMVAETPIVWLLTPVLEQVMLPEIEPVTAEFTLTYIVPPFEGHFNVLEKLLTESNETSKLLGGVIVMLSLKPTPETVND